MKHYTNINLQKNELQNARVQNLAGAPSAPVGGQIYFDTTAGRIYLYDTVQSPNAWVLLGQVDSISGSTFVSIGGTADTPSISLTNTSSTGGANQLLVTDGSGNIDLSGSGGTLSVATPVNDNETANKAYVDSVAAGLDWKDSVRYSSTSNITNFASAATVQAALDPVGASAPTLVEGDRILVRSQTNAVDNGIYVATGSPLGLVRATDLDTGDTSAGVAVFVEEGDTYGDTGWVVTSDQGADTIGTHNINWSQFTGGASITAGDGLIQSGNAFNVNPGDGILITGDAVTVDLFDVDSGLEFAAEGSPTTNGLRINLAANSGLTTTGGLQLDATVAGAGLSLTSGVLDVNVQNGIEISGDTLQLDLDPAGALVFDISSPSQGIGVNVDNTTIQINGSNELEVVGYSGLTKKYAQDIILGTVAGQQTITHNLATNDVIVNVYDSTGELVIVDVDYNSANTNTILLTATGPNATFRVVVVG